MTGYRLTNATTNEEIMFGISNADNNATIKKINAGLASMRPYNECIPYQPGMTFDFISLNALKYFLFGVCELLSEDIEELMRLGYVVLKEELETYSRGLSNSLCTKFDDEVLSSTKYDMSSLINNNMYTPIKKEYCSDDEVQFCIDKYYTKVKFIN